MPLVLSCLPQDFTVLWARNSKSKEQDLKYLLDFLDEELKSRDISQSFKGFKASDSNKTEEKRAGSVSALSATNLEVSCNVCGKSHPTHKCFLLTKVDVSKRHDILLRNGLCFKCLDSEHIAPSCDEICDRCKGGHHYLLCRGGGQGNDNDNDEGKTETGDTLSG